MARSKQVLQADSVRAEIEWRSQHGGDGVVLRVEVLGGDRWIEVAKVDAFGPFPHRHLFEPTTGKSVVDPIRREAPLECLAVLSDLSTLAAGGLLAGLGVGVEASSVEQLKAKVGAALRPEATDPAA